VKSVKPRARKVASTPQAPDVKSTKSEDRRAGITSHVSSISPERGRKVKRNELWQCELV